MNNTNETTTEQQFHQKLWRFIKSRSRNFWLYAAAMFCIGASLLLGWLTNSPYAIAGCWAAVSIIKVAVYREVKLIDPLRISVADMPQLPLINLKKPDKS